jgi:hypothetical protein
VFLGWTFVTDVCGLRTWVHDMIVDYVTDSLSDLGSPQR